MIMFNIVFPIMFIKVFFILPLNGEFNLQDFNNECILTQSIIDYNLHNHFYFLKIKKI